MTTVGTINQILVGMQVATRQCYLAWNHLDLVGSLGAAQTYLSSV